MGVLISLLTAAGLVGAICKPSQSSNLLILFIVFFYLIMGSTRNLVAPYYLIPALPALYLIIGRFVTNTLEVIELKYKHINPICYNITLILFLSLSLFTPLHNLINHELSLMGKNTRYIAKDWIEHNIPSGVKILMDSGKSINSFAPPIAENEISLKRTIVNVQENLKNGIIQHGMVDSNALIYYELLLKTVPAISYDITSTMFGLEVESIDYYVDNNFGYFIISDMIKKSRTSPFFHEANPKIANFYQQMNHDPRLELIHTVRNSRVNRGDVFYIYKINSSSSSLGKAVEQDLKQFPGAHSNINDGMAASWQPQASLSVPACQ